MNMKKIVAALLACACAFSISVTSFAYDRSIIDQVVDSDGEIADTEYDAYAPGSYYYYVIGPSSDYDILTNSDYLRFSMKKKTNGKYIDDAELIEKKFGGNRYVCIQFRVKDNFTEEEYKIEMEAQFRAKKDLVAITSGLSGSFPSFRPATSSDTSTGGSAVLTQLQREKDALNNKTPFSSPATSSERRVNELLQAITDAENALANAVSGATPSWGSITSLTDAQLDSLLAGLPSQASVNQANQQASQQAAKRKERMDYLNQEISRIETEIRRLETDLSNKRASIPDSAAAQQKVNDLRTELANFKERQSLLAGISTALANYDAAPSEATFNALKAAVQKYHPAQTSMYDGSAITPNMLDAIVYSAPLPPSNLTPATPVTPPGTGSDAFGDLDGSFSVDSDNSLDDGMESVGDDGESDVMMMSATTAVLANANTGADAARDTAIATIRSAVQSETPALTAMVNDYETNRIPTAQQEINSLQNTIAAAQQAVRDAENALAAYKAGDGAKLEGYRAELAQLQQQDSTVIPGTTLTQEQVRPLVSSVKSARKARLDAINDKQAEIDRLSSVGGSTTPGYLKSGDTYYKNFKFYIGNQQITDDDATFYAGEKGVVIKPVKNEINTVTWENSNGYIASVRFRADSEVNYYCPRLSTAWNNEDYTEYFNNRDAYLYDFVGNPKLPCTSRATLSLYNPYVDGNGRMTVSKNKIYVYEVVDGELIDRSNSFSFGENDDGDSVLTLQTRTLGTYIISDGKANVDKKKPSNNNNNNNSSNNQNNSNKGPTININQNTKPIPNTGR